MRSLPLCGRIPWFAREFRPGQGERTSFGPGGDQVEKFWAEETARRRGMVGRSEVNIVVDCK